jgi:hypothetical protein
MKKRLSDAEIFNVSKRATAAAAAGRKSLPPRGTVIQSKIFMEGSATAHREAHNTSEA